MSNQNHDSSRTGMANQKPGQQSQQGNKPGQKPGQQQGSKPSRDDAGHSGTSRSSQR